MKLALTTVMDKEFTQNREGLFWPYRDELSWSVRGDFAQSLDVVMPYVKSREIVVQAGGNCGLWPAVLAKAFRKVYTFEPDPVNFYCLVRNCQFPNVVKIQAALGAPDHAPIEMDGNPQNCGGYFVRDTEDGFAPVLTIDTLHLTGVGLIYLDIEGFESYAIEGARETLMRDRPVLAIEQKKHGVERYGIKKPQLEAQIAGLGYVKATTVLNDHVYIPQEQA